MKAVTHNGIFHADDVFAAAVLHSMYPNVSIARTRNPEVIAAADIAFDVGAEYDPARLRFDHHQRGGAGERPNGVRYAAFGLVWQHYGPELVGDEIAAMVDERLVQAVDAGDCGQAITVAVDGFESVRSVGVSSVILSMNPSWHEGGDRDVAFELAVGLAGVLLTRAIAACQGEVLARDLVRAAVADGDEIVVLPRCCPWQEIVVEESSALFVVYPAETGDTWMVQCVPPKLGSFDKRKPLPESWAGLRDADFAAECGVEDAVFCHPGRFICGAQSRDGAMALATKAVADG